MACCTIKCLSYNVRGLQNYTKRKKLYIWLDENDIDVAFLQETHCTEKKRKIYFLKLGWECV